MRAAPVSRGSQVARVLILALLASTLSGCYLLQAAAGQLAVNARRTPIARLVADPATAPELRARLLLVTRVRAFASAELGLPDNGSYKSYADLKRTYVVWNVVATQEFSVEPHTWCFPLVGCVAYRGYFDELKARGYAYRLERGGEDVLVYGVPAYSTLGHFADPVLNTMIGWGDAELAGLIFHELGHVRLYVPSDSAFNEAFATVVQEEGLRRWLAANGEAAPLEEFRRRLAHEAELARLVAATRAQLAALYASGAAAAEMRREKAATFARLQQEYLARRGPARGGYDTLFFPTLNNASLLTFATYFDCVPGFRTLLAEVGGDLPTFYARSRELAQKSAAERHRLLCTAGAS
jgi:predicted aminopeptidase